MGLPGGLLWDVANRRPVHLRENTATTKLACPCSLEQKDGHYMNDSERQRMEEVYARRDAKPYSYFNPGQLWLIQQQEREMLGALRRLGVGSQELRTLKIFEVGCGSGHLLRQIVQWGADPRLCSGADIRGSAIERGKQISPTIRIYQGDCSRTLEPSSEYDLVVQSTVLSSVLREDLRHALAREVIRITRPGGLILSCDVRFDNPNNANVRKVTKSDLLRLFHGCKLELCKPILLVPPVARRVGRLLSTRLCDLLSVLPFLRGHYLAVFRKP